MKVIVDTCVWSLALRRSHVDAHPCAVELRELISEYRVQMLGPVRQELLSGIRTESDFQRLREHLRHFPDLALEVADYESAAEFYNSCRNRGIQGSNTDFLICAAASRYRLPIFTLDQDFVRYQTVLPIQLHAIRAA